MHRKRQNDPVPSSQPFSSGCPCVVRVLKGRRQLLSPSGMFRQEQGRRLTPSFSRDIGRYAKYPTPAACCAPINTKTAPERGFCIIGFVARACLQLGSAKSTARYGFLLFGSAFSFLGSADS